MALSGELQVGDIVRNSNRMGFWQVKQIVEIRTIGMQDTLLLSFICDDFGQKKRKRADEEYCAWHLTRIDDIGKYIAERRSTIDDIETALIHAHNSHSIRMNEARTLWEN